MFQKCLVGSLLIHLLIFLGVGFYPAPGPLLSASSGFFQLVTEPESGNKTVIRKKTIAIIPPSPKKSGKVANQPLRAELSNVSLKEIPVATGFELKVATKSDPIISTINSTLGNSAQEPGKLVTDNNGNGNGLARTASGASEGTQTNKNKAGTGNELGEGYNPKGYDTAPQVIYCPHPKYPIIARKKNWEGVAIIEAILEKDGRIGIVKVLQSSGYQVLDQEAVRAVKQRRYHPALKDGVPVAAILHIKIPFKLEDSQ